tara:strand:+ start:2598 stop:3755 length:1158 start_codon:yes stop_codon:yes gene_type:complete
MAEIQDLEIVDASNTDRFPENMRVNAVNNSARALEGMLARGLKDNIDGAVTTAGTTTAYTVASNRTLSAYYDGMTITVQWNATCGATPTVNVDGIGAKSLYWPGGNQVTTGDLLISARSIIQYDGTNFQVLTGSTIDTDNALSVHMADSSSHGITSNIVGETESQTLTNKTIVAASNTITTAATGNLTSTDLNAALAELQTDIDTRTTAAQAAVAAAADVALTHADVILTNSNVVLTDASVVTTTADKAVTTQDAIDTAADVVLSNANVILTNSDVVLTNSDVVLTNADVVSTAAYLDSFSDVYLGAKSSVPTLDNDGNALGDGALYFNTTTDDMWVYNLSTTTWFAVADGALLTANNLNDVANAATSLSNIGGVGVGLALALGG